ncbi:MAG: cytochrome c biogenesis protein [Patescibacteria group bacterium]
MRVLKIPFIATAFIIVALNCIGTTPANAQNVNDVDLVLFYGQGCPHCAGMIGFLEDMEFAYPSLSVHKYEIYFHEENIPLFHQLAQEYGKGIDAVPTAFIGSKSFVGFSNQIGEDIENEIENCIQNGCPSPLRNINPHEIQNKNMANAITIPAVIGAAVVDAINPCAFAVLIILITTILASGKKRRALLSGLAFSLSIFISYFLMGLGLYSAIQASGLTHTFYSVIAILAIIIGLFNLKDYLWYGKWFVMEVPMSWRPRLKALIRSVTSVPGAFLIGFVVSLFLLPCTSGPYIVVLGLLAHTTTRSHALVLLVLYNLIFVSPMILITGAVYYGLTTTEKAEEWRTKKLKLLHLIAGLIILGLGVVMLGSLWLGNI